MVIAKTFDSALKQRRSFYAISKDSVISDVEIQSLITDAVKYTPSAFNSQSARVIVLFGAQHDRLWDITKETLRPLVPADKFSSTEEKVDGFKNGYGTVLFFEDQDTVAGLQTAYPLYKDNFPVWSLESSGMLQSNVWMMLEAAGFGVNLQHYNPLIDGKVRETWNVPSGWKLLAEMPFGKPLAEPDRKDFLPVEDRLKIYK
ncbi:MAG: nitroreductase family protein [Treponema sp.]|nr:nitroreductase family protein [Treponema sp.]